MIKLPYVGVPVPLAFELKSPIMINGRFVLAGPAINSLPWAT
nr:hypothetical protein [Bacillus wiedmannii]